MATPTQSSGTVSDIIQRRDESKKWLRYNYWDEWVETWRMIKCRTKPLRKLDSAGKETNEEDKSRTNVESGLANLIYRKNVARLSAQPYTLRVRGGSDPSRAARLSALLSHQYDTSQERSEDVRVRMAAESLGIGVSKLYWDFISRNMVFRKAIMKEGKIVARDRGEMMRFRNAPDAEIQQSVEEHGASMSDDEVNEFMAKSGAEITVPQVVEKYEGPRIKCCFPGDVYWEPFARTLRQSSFVTECYSETDLWLKKMLGVKYKDPETGEMTPAFDPEAVAGLMRLDPEPVVVKGEFQELKDLFRTAVGKQDQVQYQFPRNLRVRKRYDILEEHKQDDDGRMWITWCNENYRDKVLGKMPYPVNFYGDTAFTDEVPLPDLIDAIGDSTPRLLRFMFMLFNLQHCQNFDYVTNLIRVTYLAPAGLDFDTDVLERGMFRIVRVSGGNPNSLQPVPTPPLPPGAMERGAAIMQLIGMFEPSLQTTTDGTTYSPQSSKTATTAVLNAKAADVLLAFKMESRNFYLYQLGMKKIWMNQQMADMDKSWEVPSKYFGGQMRDYFAGKGIDPKKYDVKSYLEQQQNQAAEIPWIMTDQGGMISSVKLDPMEIQEDFECEPEAGSYMAVDDDLRRQAAVELDQVAMQAPDVLDRRKVIVNHLKTIKGIDQPEDFLAPERTTPPPPPVKVNVSLTGKIEDVPGAMNALLQELGLPPSQDLAEQGQLNTIKRLSQASDHASNLLSNPDATDEEGSSHGTPVEQAETVTA
jgi:hypothetical protein